jgi:L-serine dehydratase
MQSPSDIDPDHAAPLAAALAERKFLSGFDGHRIRFDPAVDLSFDMNGSLPGHPNGMTFRALTSTGELLVERQFYSPGGGFVLSAEEMSLNAARGDHESYPEVPFPFSSAAEMLTMGKRSGLSIADMKRENEVRRSSVANLNAGIDRIALAMNLCIERGLGTTGKLPGPLFLDRRAAKLSAALMSDKSNAPPPHRVLDWLSVYAMAVNEENASGARVVTAPTNGAAGVVPAVLRYYQTSIESASTEGVRDFLLTAAAIAGLIKANASISGAEVGCQGEVGTAAAMAAAGLVAALGGSNEQIENAAEIALEHHLGLTCDPVGGLVQIPCIERNALGAGKAVHAASLAIAGSGSHLVSLDACIETMRQTGLDMNRRYKETSLGGLAANVTVC